MKILHFSDIHIWRLAIDLTDPALKRFLGFANLLLMRRRNFPRKNAVAVVEEILRTPADAVVFSGDITSTSLEREFRAASRLFAPIQERWNGRFFVIPGNHDRYTHRTLRRRYYEKHFQYGAFDKPYGSVRTIPIGDRLVIVGFDCCVPRPFESTGLFTPELAQSLDATLDAQEREGRRVILVGHYPYAAPPEVRIKKTHRLVGFPNLVEIIARRKPILYLHGHKHRRWAFYPPQTPDTLCVNAGSAALGFPHPSARAGFAAIQLDESCRPRRVDAHVLGPLNQDPQTSDPPAPPPFQVFPIFERLSPTPA